MEDKEVIINGYEYTLEEIRVMEDNLPRTYRRRLNAIEMAVL